MQTEKVFRYSFQMAEIVISLKTEQPIEISKRFQPFLLEENSSGDYEVEFREVNRLADLPERWLYREQAFDVGRCASGRYCRRFRDMEKEEGFYAAAFYDWEQKKILVEYLSGGKENINQSDNCFFHIAWETIMQLENRMILHACGVDSSYGGILFSGRSGIGKSTQGRLWCEYEDAVQINGDRPLIRKEGDRWYMYGAPYAGSSRCHVNRRAPIRAVVMLQQGGRCKVRKLNAAEAFRKLYAEMTVSEWNPDCVNRSCDLAIALAAEVPVYEMECVPDRRAVETLKNTLLAEEFS